MTVLQEFMAVLSAGLVITLFLAIFYERLLRLLTAGPARLLLLLSPLLGLLPVGDIPLYYYIRGAVGDLSITSQMIILALAMHRLTGIKLVDDESSRTLHKAIPIAGLLLYPAALGLFAFDSYRPGFEGLALPILFSLFAMWAWWRQQLFLACVLATALLMTGIMESGNLWDYVIDPLIFITYSTQWLAGMAKRMKSGSISD